MECRLERLINLSRNDAADNIDVDTFFASQENLANDYWILCSDTQLATAKSLTPQKTLIRELAIEASTQANSFLSSIETIGRCKMARVVQEHAAIEPHTDVCDAILVTPIPNTPDETGIGVAKFLEAYELVRRPQLMHTNSNSLSLASLGYPSSASRPSSTREEPSTHQEKSHIQNGKSLTRCHDRLLHSPLQLSSMTDSRAIVDVENLGEHGLPAIGPDDLLLPCMLVEYKNFNDNEMQALNQARTHCVSALTFLAAIGIKGRPIFCLITSGKIGSVILAWHSNIQDVCV
jgi:hypothetical protein